MKRQRLNRGARNAAPPQAGKDLQGEGNYEATRHYDAATERFVRSGKVDEAARAAAPKSPAEDAEMKDAERRGLSRAKGVDHPETAVEAADAAELAMEKDRKGAGKSPRATSKR